MKVDLIIGKTNLDCFEKVVDILRERDRSLNHIIITPDRNALNVEEMIIDMLGEECMADFSVSTFSRFANNVIKKSNNGLDRKILSKSACVSIIKNIIVVFLGYPITWTLSALMLYIYYKKANWINP